MEIHSHASFGDSNYPQSKECIWHLSGPPGERHTIVDITYEFFELEMERDCNYDYLEIKSYGKGTVKKCRNDAADPSQPTSVGSHSPPRETFGLPGTKLISENEV